MELATGLIALSEFEEARETLTSFLSASPKNPEALALLGVISRKEKRIEESDEYSRQALELAPHNTSALMNLAINSMEKKQPSAVIEFAQRVLADDCKAWRAWELIGRAREQLGDTDAAEEAFKQVADIQPQQSDGWQGIARNVRSYERAAAAARKAAQVDCENAVAQALPGMTEARFGRNADAIQSLISVLSQHPENDIALNAFNDLWVPLEKTDAIEVLRQVTAECPEWPLGWRLLAHDYAALQRLPEALDALKRAAGQHEGEKLPGFAGILSDLVIASATSGDLEGAAKTCERLEQLDAPLAKSMRERYLQQTQSPR
jgi:predicted Zn-dependent protease